MYKTLLDIGLTEASLVGTTIAENLEIIFDAMEVNTELSVHVSADGALADTCPSQFGTAKRGVLSIRKLDSVVAKAEYLQRVGGYLYTGVFVKSPLAFYGWTEALTKVVEDLDDTTIESKVAKIESVIGDINLMDHYGQTIVEVLNKYTRQVLTDSSSVPNKITLENYYGNIQDISYDTPIIVQVANNSVNWTPGVDNAPIVEFKKDVYVDGVFSHVATTTYPLKMVDLTGAWNTYKNISAGDMTKNVFYNIIKRDEGADEIFVLLAQSGESEVQSIGDRVTAIEGKFNVGLTTLSVANIIASAITTGTLSTTGNTAIGGTLTVTGRATFNNASTTQLINGATIGGTTTVSALTVGTSINLSTAAVTLKASPGTSDLVNKAYVDTKATTTKTEVMANFITGTATPPATGTPGTFYFQLVS